MNISIIVFFLFYHHNVFSQDAGIEAIITPKAIGYCHLDSVDFTFVVKNYGAMPIIGLPYSVLVTPVNGGIPYSNTGLIATLAGGATDTITCSGMDISITDSYLFTAYTLLTGDINVNNDIMVVQPTSSHTTISLSGTNLNCNNDSSGTITPIASDGITPYTYNWSSGETTANISNAHARVYMLTLDDSTGCSSTQSITITEPSAISSTAVDNGNGSATATASGGTGSYSFLWDNNDTSATATGLTSGIHTVTITDGNGCTDTTSVSIVVSGITPLGDSGNSLKIYPNPAKSHFKISLNTPLHSDITTEIYSLRGELLFRTESSFLSSREVNISGLTLPPGMYIVQLINYSKVYTTRLSIK